MAIRAKVVNRRKNRNKNMTRVINFLKSDLFFSLAGGFALGVAGLALVKPASADIPVEQSRSISVELPAHVK